MAKLFSKEYHEISNTWYFKQNKIKLKKEQVKYTVYKMHGSFYKIEFSITFDSFDKSLIISFDYDQKTEKLINFSNYDSYDYINNYYRFALIAYAYENLTTNILEEYKYTIYENDICRYNENDYKKINELHYQVEGLYDVSKDTVKIYFSNLNDIQFNDLLEYAIQDKFLHITYLIKNIPFVKAISSEEQFFLSTLLKLRRSIGKKKHFISLSLGNFVKLLPLMKNITDRLFIYETGDRLIFTEKPLHIEFVIEQVDPDVYLFKLAEQYTIHRILANNESYILSNNTIQKVILPFKNEVITKIFNDQFLVDKSELVYYKTIIAKHLTANNHHLDFSDDTEFPKVHEETPEVYIILENKNKNLSIFCYLEYSDSVKVPVSFIHKKVKLVSIKNESELNWYYISDDLSEELDSFLTNYLYYRDNIVNEFSWTITNDLHKMLIKENLYEKANPNWNIIMNEKLKKEFIQSITLVPEIIINQNEEIDWFSYKIIYKFQNITVTQDDLRAFFKTGSNVLKAPDGSLVTIKNREVFDELEDLVKLSKKDADYFHRASIYRLPWIYELKKINPAINIHGDEYLQNMYTALINRSLIDKTEPYYTLKPVMRSYQKHGYDWLKMLEKYKLSGVLADDMGLGKTLQAISILTDLEPDTKSLIICPKTLLFNWAAEIEKFNPQLKYIIYEGNKKDRINLLNNSAVQLVFCSYSLIQNDLTEFKKINFEYIILDEAQHIKNHNTLRAKAVKKLKSRFKLAMTGTPLENSILELWSVFDFLMPGYLPAMSKFKELFSSEQDSIKQSLRVKQYISPFILRRKKQDVLVELPDKQEQYVYCPMAENQEKKYIQILKAVKKDVFKDGENEANYITMLAALTRLRQVCDHPGMINEEWLNEKEISGKMDTLKELIEDAIENNRKLLVFSQYVKMLKLIEKMINKLNIKYEYMDGSTKDRETVINHFNDNEKVRLFLISLKTGGFGINLTSADTVILVDPWWNPMVESQAIDRVHRMGQTKKVLVYKMITVGSVEEKIMILQKRKRDLFENVIDQGDSVLKNLEYEEIKSLFEYKE